jgi:lipoprotein signal peptidase
MKIRTILYWVIILVIIDQIIKIIVNAYFLESRFDIIPSLFEFRPCFNTKHSYFNVLLYKHFNIDIGLYAHIILFLIIEIVVLIFYVYFRNIDLRSKKLLDFAFIFQLAGVICAFSGNLIWEKGTLDYIYLKPLFIFDLKDLYLNCFLVLFLIFLLRNDTETRKIKLKDVVLYIKNEIFKKENE